MKHFASARMDPCLFLACCFPCDVSLSRHWLSSHCMLHRAQMSDVQVRKRIPQDLEQRDARICRSKDAPWRITCQRMVNQVHSVFIFGCESWSWSHQALNRTKGWATDMLIFCFGHKKGRQDAGLGTARHLQHLARTRWKNSHFSCRKSLLRVCGGVWALFARLFCWRNTEAHNIMVDLPTIIRQCLDGHEGCRDLHPGERETHCRASDQNLDNTSKQTRRTERRTFGPPDRTVEAPQC